MANPKQQSLPKSNINAEEAFNRMKAMVDQNDERMIGQFGLRNPAEVIQFLKSPAGKSVLERIAAEIAFTEAMKKENAFNAQQQDMHKRILLSFLLYIMGVKEAKAQKLHAAIAQSLPQQVRNTPAQTSYSPSSQAQRDLLAAYDHQINALTAAINVNAKQLTQAQTQLQKHTQRQALALTKYNTLNTHLNGATGLIAQWDTQLLDDNNRDRVIRDVEKTLDLLDEQIEALDSQFQTLVETQDQENDPEAAAALEKLSAQALALRLNREEISQYQSNLLEETQAYDENFEPTTEYQQTKYYVPKTMQIFIQDGNIYLLSSDVDIQNLSHEEKASAKEAFKHTVDNFVRISLVVKGQTDQNIKTFEATGRELQDQVDNLREEAKYLNAARTQLTEAKAEVETRLSPEKSPAPTPKPNPHRELSDEEVVAAANIATSLYDENGQAVIATREDLFALCDGSEHEDEARKTLQDEFSQAPAGDLGFMTMQRALQTLNQFGINVNKPNVTAIPNPRVEERTAEQQRKAPKMEPTSSDSSPSTTPNPFYIKKTPYNGS